jgi:ribosome-associated protein
VSHVERIPESDLAFSFVRAAGPGGQNVNKVASAAQLRFDLAGTQALNERVKARLRALAGRRLTAEGAILILARNHRTQEGNRREALARLDELIGRALVEPKLRRATKPTRASKERRLEGKARSQKIKRLRRPVRGED